MEIIGVTKSVQNYLRVHIITRNLVPGQKLNEAEIAARLDVSRAPIREAFRILENESLVTSAPRKGCFVSEMSIKDCLDIFAVRTMIECFAIDILKADNIREVPNVAEVLKKTDDLPLPLRDDPYGKYEYLREIAAFHIQLVATSNNARLMTMYNAILPSLARYQSLYTYIPGLMDESHRDHEQILKLIAVGKHEKAKELLAAHISKFIEFVEERIGEPGRPSNG